MTGPPRNFGTRHGFSHALKSAINARLKSSSRTYPQLERAFYLQRFLARVFADPENRWVLKGGTGLLTRFPDVARHSQDIDLLYRSGKQDGLEAAADELQRVAGAIPDLDPFRFTIQTRTTKTGGAGGAGEMQLTIVVSFGAAELHRFPIDLVADLPITAQLDHHDPQPVIELEAVGALPAFTLYPLPDQVADKVCAMYQRYGTRQLPSSRYRDLVDLLIIIGNNGLDAASLVQALQQEATRRRLQLPLQLLSPAPIWATGYPTEARTSALPQHLHQLDQALAIAGECLDPILSGAVTAGTWTPGTRHWEPIRDAP